MQRFYWIVLSVFLMNVLQGFAQDESKTAFSTEWKTISMGKLQKKPVFKEPMIAVRFIAENNERFFHLSLKYMFTDAVFEEAVPVEYYKNEKFKLDTEKNSYELRAVKYSRARRMSSVAQKTADIKVIFSGSLSFLENELVKNMTVHYAQGYQHIKINPEEASLLREMYKQFLASLPKQKEPVKPVVKIDGEVAKAKKDTVQHNDDSLEKLRKQARKWSN